MRAIKAALHTILILIVTSHAAYAAGSELARLAGRPVLSLEVQGAQITPAQLADLVPFKAGAALKSELVRQGIINFFETGLYDQVEVYLIELSDGVKLKYILQPKQWLDRITFTGNLDLDDRELLSRVDLRSNEEIDENSLDLNVQKLQNYYEFRGFTGTKISYRIRPGRGSLTSINFIVKEGERRFISDVRLVGDPGMTRFRLLRIVSSMPGSKLDGEDLDVDLERLRKHLRRKMYLVPRLNYRVEASADFPGGVLVVFTIQKGYLYRLQAQMENEEESRKIHRKMRSVFRKTETPEKAKLVMEKWVLDRYRKEGYPFAVAEFTDQVEGAGIRNLKLEVDTGLRAVIGDVSIQGARFFRESEVRQWLGLFRGEPFVKTALDEGMESVELQYRKEGFLSMVLKRQPLNFIAREGYREVMINLQVQEGTRSMIKSLEVTGSPVREDRMQEVLGFSEGDPYVPEIVSQGQDALLLELGSTGYLFASLKVEEPEISPDGMVDLTVSVSSGPKVRLGNVSIEGNESVDDKIIRLALDLKRGEVLTQEKILKGQEGIYDLKVMSTVDVQLFEPQIPGQNKDLLVRVQERPKYVVGLRGGYGSEDKLRGEVSVTNRNIGRMARSLTLSGNASDIERNITLLYSHPWFQSLPIDMTASLIDLVEKRESYSRDSLSGAVDFVRPLTERTETRFGYFFEGLRLFDVSPDAQLSPDDEGRTDVAALVGEILYDARDDFLDPWTGALGDVIVELASGIIGSKTEYVKTEIAARRYINPTDEIVLAGLLRLGIVKAYGQSEEVIISERFFLGGQNSVRGYALDALGPQDNEGDPVGGNFLVNVNLEVRYPLYKTIRGVVFIDSGSIWLDNATDPEDERFNLRFATGAGLRWSSPIGPLSLDYGYKLNPAEEDEDDRYRWHFSIGHAF